MYPTHQPLTTAGFYSVMTGFSLEDPFRCGETTIPREGTLVLGTEGEAHQLTQSMDQKEATNPREVQHREGVGVPY